jgi:prepilin-type N-terminal cleavage/methylation domain-containing protein
VSKINEIISGLRKPKSEEGFTLIELVIVVAIIGILTAIAIPAYGAIQATARQGAVDTTIKSKATQVAAIYAEKGDIAAKTVINSRSEAGANVFYMPTTGAGTLTNKVVCQLFFYLNDGDADDSGVPPEFSSTIQYIYSGQPLDNAPFAWGGIKYDFTKGDPDIEILNSDNYISSCPLV